jgi:oxygen-independent coproporphyrinogen-3 oxidase
MMGLRLTEGVSRSAFRRETGTGPEDLLDRRRLEALKAAGFLAVDDDGAIRATAVGRQRLNALCGYLLAGSPTAAVS